MNRALSAMTVMMAAVATNGCMSGEGSDLGLVSQSIVPGIGTTCAAGALEGNATPERDATAPWSQVEGNPSPVRTASGQIVVSHSGGNGVAFTRYEPRAAGATQVVLDVNVAIQPDAFALAEGCPAVPVANIGVVVSDGARMAGLAVGRMRNAAGVVTNYVAIRALDRCATPIAVAPFTFDITEFHVYSVRLDRTNGAAVYIDKEDEPTLRVAYDRLDAAAPLGGAQFGFRTERAVASWDYLRYSACGVTAPAAPPPVSSCGGPCPGNRAPSCAGAAASPASLWPPNHSFRPVRVVGLTDPDGDVVSYTISHVTSDEPNDAQGSGDDGDDVGRQDQDLNEDGSPRMPGDRQNYGRGVLLRAERSGMGNGRVYALHVTGNDGRGGTCQATVRVCVPHDSSGAPCVDDGQDHDATTPPTPPPPPVEPVAPGTLRCPAPSSALAGSPVTLRATGAGAATTVRWSVTTAPSYTRAYRFASEYDDADVGAMVGRGTEVPFTSVIVGDFTVHAEAVYPNGTIDECDTTVTMRGHGLRIELSWNTQDTDVDLHALRESTGRWFTSQDCYYANRRPDASLPEDSRRWLDTDDVDGEGPENIRVDTPATDRDYQIGVHFYSAHGQRTPTRATVVIYCGEQRMGTYQRVLTGDRGSPNANDFWHVAAVRFAPGSACSVRSVEQLMTATQARNGG